MVGAGVKARFRTRKINVREIERVGLLVRVGVLLHDGVVVRVRV